jgi:hypothetical protein
MDHATRAEPEALAIENEGTIEIIDSKRDYVDQRIDPLLLSLLPTHFGDSSFIPRPRCSSPQNKSTGIRTTFPSNLIF